MVLSDLKSVLSGLESAFSSPKSALIASSGLGSALKKPSDYYAPAMSPL